jgi:orotate phosphoribosyltransferase
MKAIERAREEGLEVVGVVTLVDREEGGSECFAAAGIPFKAIFTKTQVAA